MEKTVLEKFVHDWREHQPTKGNVVFACTGGDDYASVSTWNFDDAVYDRLLASGYRTEFLLTLNRIIPDRMTAGLTPNDGGEIEFTASGIEIKWLNARDALDLRDKVWDKQR